ncbi:hypothetical protein, partial [Streptomyces brasiliscabiei]
GGENSTLVFRCWDGKRYTNVVVKTGIDGVEADVPYQIDEDSNVLIKAEDNSHSEADPSQLQP